jgi:hypothetical protein
MKTEGSGSIVEETSKPTGYFQEVRIRISGHIYLLQLDSSLTELRLPPFMRPFGTKALDLVIEVPCTDGMVEIPAKAQMKDETESGAVYELFGLNPQDCQKLYNHFDNLSEGIQVTRAMLAEDKAPAMEERDFQLLEKNRELTDKARLEPGQRRKQLVLSTLFLVIIGFFGWLLFISLYDIVAEDWGQQEYYTRISQARLSVAEAQLREVDANLEFTRAMLAKLHDPQFQQGVSPLQVEIFARDEKILQAHHDQMTEVVALLKINREEVAKGNFFYERRVLDSFSTQDRQTASSSSAVLMMK